MATTPLYRIATSFTGYSGGPFYNQLYVDAGSATAQQATDRIGEFWDALAPVMFESLAWTTESVVDTINPVSGQIVSSQGVTPFSGSGIAGGSVLPPADQGLISWRTGIYVNGRELKGRTFVPGVMIASSSSGRPTPTYVSSLAAAASALAAAGLAIYSRTHGQWAPVVAAQTPGFFAVLRSRRD